MRAIGFIVIWCLTLGLVQGAAAEPPAPEQNRGGVGSTASVAGSEHAAVAHGDRVHTSTVASAPKITTDAAYGTGAMTAIVTGNGDPEGWPTRLHADYAPAGERWCTTQGTKGKPARTRPQKLGSGHAMISELSVKLEGLTGGTEYCAELVATNRSGTSHGEQVRFATSADNTLGGSQASRTPRLPRGASPSPPSTPHSGWPRAAIVTVAALGAILLGGVLAVTRAKLRPRRRDSTGPVAG